jgi:hypothetical protein
MATFYKLKASIGELFSMENTRLTKSQLQRHMKMIKAEKERLIRREMITPTVPFFKPLCKIEIEKYVTTS